MCTHFFVCIYVCSTRAHDAPTEARRASGSQGLELQMIVATLCVLCVLGIEPESAGAAASALSGARISRYSHVKVVSCGGLGL